MKKLNTVERPFEEEAHIMTAAIRELAANESALDNFEGYLSRHFKLWLVKFAYDPENMAGEFKNFASIHD